MSSRRRSLILAGITLLVAALIATDWVPVLRGPMPESSEWHWPYALKVSHRLLAPLLPAALILLTAAWWLKQSTDTRRTRFLALTGLFLGALLMQLSLVTIDRADLAAEMVDRTLAMNSNGYFRIAAETSDLGALLNNYPAAMPHFETEHARTHPPGLIIVNWLTIRFFEQVPGLAQTWGLRVQQQRCTDLWLWDQTPAVAAALGLWAFLPVMLAAMTVFPAYWLAVRLAGPKRAKLAALFTAVLPSLLLFSPLPDQLFALLTAAALLALQRGLDSGQARWFFLAGLILSIGSFLSLGNGALLLVMLLYAALTWWFRTPRQLRTGLKWAAALAFGTIAVWALYWLIWRIPPWQVVRVGMAQHYDLVTRNRVYSWWLLYNLVDLVIFVGVPVLAGFLMLVGGAARRLIRRSPMPSDLLALSLFVLILFLDLTGTARGETGRLWLFFMPLLAILAGIQFSFLDDVTSAVVYTGLQLLVVIGLGAAWVLVDAVIVVAEPPIFPVEAAAAYAQPIHFSEQFAMAGYDLPSKQLGDLSILPLTLYWDPAGPAKRPYTVFAHLLNESGEIVAQKDSWPLNGSWPPSCWQPGSLVVDPYEISLPANLPSGQYHLRVGMYDAADGSRLTTADGSDAVILNQTLEK